MSSNVATDNALPFHVPTVNGKREKRPNVNLDSEVNNAVPRTTAEDTALAKTLEALTIRIEQKSVKTVSERAQAWIPTLLTCLVLGITTVRFDAVRETKTDTSLVMTQAKVEELSKRDIERKAEIEMWRTYVTALVIELKSKGIKIPPMPKGE